MEDLITTRGVFVLNNELYRISGDGVYVLVDRMVREYVVFGPVMRNGDISFEQIQESSILLLDYKGRALLPVKKFFLPPREVLFEYEIIDGDIVIRDRLSASPQRKKLLFGVRACDIAGLEIMRKTFDRNFRDPYVLSRMESMVVIGVMCSEVLPTCFCYQADSGPLPKGGFDMFLVPLGDHYLVEVGSKEGRKIVLDNKDLFSQASPGDVALRDSTVEKLIEKMRNINIPHLSTLYNRFIESYESSLWDVYAERCLSCGKCNFVCPTCYCFDIHDETDLGLKRGARIREWDSCHFLSFTRVASGEIFRRDRSSRVKQRIYHKFVYSINDIGSISCVGCGRCVEVCPASIDPREIIREIIG